MKNHVWVWPNGMANGAECMACGLSAVGFGPYSPPCPGPKSVAPAKQAGRSYHVWLGTDSHRHTRDGFNDLWGGAPETTPVPTAPEKPTCLRCGREISACLDAYYGRDAYEAKCCSKCRSRK